MHRIFTHLTALVLVGFAVGACGGSEAVSPEGPRTEADEPASAPSQSAPPDPEAEEPEPFDDREIGPEAEPDEAATASEYLACGCGCCGGPGGEQERTPECVESEAALETIRVRDRAARGSAGCHAAGCSLGTLYRVCE